MKMINYFIHKLISCTRCFGTGVIEKPNGDTKECHICSGKGYLK